MIHLQKATAIAALLFIFAIVQSCNGLSWTYSFDITPEELLNQEFDASFAGEDHHAFALLECSDFSGRSLGHCNLKILRHYFDNNVKEKTCPINPLTEGNELRIREIRFLNADKVLITWDGKHMAHEQSKTGWKRSAQIISLDSCQQGEYLNIKKFGRDDNNNPPYMTIPFENDVDIIYDNDKKDKECGESFYCRLRFDYDKAVADRKPFPGSDISKPSKFVKIDDVFWMENGNPDKYVIVGKTDENDSENGFVYSPVTGYTKLEQYPGGSFSYSNANGFATLCWRGRDPGTGHSIRLTCKWLDGTHKDETFVADHYYFRDVPRTINTPDGNILVVTNSHFGTINIEEIRSDNKCKKFEELNWSGKINRPYQTSLTKDRKLCISGTYRHRKQDSSYRDTSEYGYKFATECIKLSNNGDFSDKCGKTKYD